MNIQIYYPKLESDLVKLKVERSKVLKEIIYKAYLKGTYDVPREYFLNPSMSLKDVINDFVKYTGAGNISLPTNVDVEIEEKIKEMNDLEISHPEYFI